MNTFKTKPVRHPEGFAVHIYTGPILETKLAIVYGATADEATYRGELVRGWFEGWFEAQFS